MKQAQKGFRKGGAVAVAVAGDAAGYVDSFRRRYDPQVTRIMPHITLAFARGLETVPWSLARAGILGDLREMPPFTVHVAETGVFVQNGFVLWLRPTVEHDELVSLRNIVLKPFPDVAFERPDDFVPHISIGFFGTQDALLKARDIVQRELHPFSFRVAYVSFLQADEGDIWQCFDTLDLGGLESGTSCG
jgi:2'-5' RNA ligase